VEAASSEALKGSLFYISPEQTGRMNRSIDYRTDFYSLGITIYQLLCGLLPFGYENVMELVHAHIAKKSARAESALITIFPRCFLMW
jgi:serine/threonine protein kinase